MSLGIPSLAGPPDLGGPPYWSLGCSFHGFCSVILEVCKVKSYWECLQVEDCQDLHPKSGYWCVLRFRILVHCAITGRKLGRGSGRMVLRYACLFFMEISHSPLASALKGSSKGPFSCLSLLNGLDTLVPSHLCVVDQQSNGLYVSPVGGEEEGYMFLW